ncbi:hypothetical protein [Hyphomicrobium sp.]|uniref:hypothetical protein n=1 Tax=Hyphomicrobium sp. TaxID=82 RepID=UPI002D77D812|nr:hypothetical protein [Hyphomicrobium sp.]HET6389220.1 hypothetical protein [Hyphomicrobium sp.]
MSDVITQWGSNLLQVLAYMVGPVVLGVMIIYGISRTWKSRSPVADAQDDATRDLYAEADEEREAKEKRKQKSSNPIDVIERKSGTTG